ncbi:dihydropyrimidinase [Martelella sp. HB161492]|uniref:dihydropyrimidinase n=1 Tax=Martelella sp. HB161492 TaxID=2720726 RepID=UPI00158FD867|nr:dihydropyrimidinase [Martelella sp. HB161492]
MSDYDLLVSGGRVVTGNAVVLCDIGIRDGVIVALGAGLEGNAKRHIDATGMIVTPGGVDGHAHIDQPDHPSSIVCDSFETATRSAAVGGTTTVVSFAWQLPGHSLKDTVADYHEKAKASKIDYAFHMTITDATDTVLEDELPALVDAGNRSIKVFMTYDGIGIDDQQILKVLEAARRNGALVCVHAEHHGLIAHMTEKLVRAGKTEPKYFPDSKPIAAEREAVNRIIALAETLDVPIEIFHVSGKEPADEIARAKARGVKVFAETCPQYLVLTRDDLDRPGIEGAKFIFGPPARTKDDQQALWQAIASGTITLISSDHSPNLFWGETGKTQGRDDIGFHEIPNGIPGIAARLPLLHHHGVNAGHIDLVKFCELVCAEPARMFGLYPRKGVIAIGSDADLVLWDRKKEVTLTNEMMHHACDYTPYEGMKVRGFPTMTLLRGDVIAENGEPVQRDPSGIYLARDAYDYIAP